MINPCYKVHVRRRAVLHAISRSRLTHKQASSSLEKAVGLGCAGYQWFSTQVVRILRDRNKVIPAGLLQGSRTTSVKSVSNLYMCRIYRRLDTTHSPAELCGFLT